MKRFIITWIIFSAFVLSSKAQDPEFTQFYSNPLYLNPAMAGSFGGVRINTSYRNQWPSVSSSFVTYSASYDQYVRTIRGGIGASIIYDKAGDGQLTTSISSIFYSYNVKPTRELTIKAGLQASVYQKSIDFNKLRFYDQIHPKRGFVLPTQEQLPVGVENLDPFPDFSFGMMAFTDKYYGGFSLHHITQPTQSFLGDNKSILPMKYTVHAGALIPLDGLRMPGKYFSPNLMYQMQHNFQQINIGAYYIQKSFVVGTWLRQTGENTDAIMFLVGFKRDPFKAAYSYDITLSDANKAAPGSHEVSMSLQFKTRKRIKPTVFKPLLCPDF